MNKFAILLLATTLSAGAVEPALKVSVLENDILCVRASQIPDNFAEQLQSDQPTNKVSGIVLDLRFADGSNTVSAESLFSGQKFPLVILVNGETSGGAAELAAKLRAAGRGILIGSTNVAGKVTPDIAIAVSAEAEKQFQNDPFAQITETNAVPSATNDLLPFVDHMSEAELVSKRAKDGEFDEPNIPRATPAQPVIRDPALARAVDLLKALAILHAARG
ncbi:MAG: hypothetical protein ABUL66_03555 [Verrucomicrobiota bacterium]